jgi:hypothetical protein
MRRRKGCSTSHSQENLALKARASPPARPLRNLFLAVFLNVGFRGLIGMVSHVNPVPPRRMRVVPSFFVITSLVMLCCFIMMVSGVRTMFRRLSVVLGCFF